MLINSLELTRASISSRARVYYDGVISADRLIIDKLVVALVGRSTYFNRCIRGIINYKLIRHSFF
jgi:hypothetical protein